jgi:DNA-binding transcriptional LysR family regulator
LPETQRSRLAAIDPVPELSVSTNEVKAFVVLAAELHFSRTAGRMHLSPARVSRLIASLERQVGGRLFDRTSRVVTLTPLGQALLARLQPAYEEMAAALQEARTRAHPGNGAISIGFTRTTEGEPLQRLVRAFRAANPGCRVTFVEVDAIGPHYDELRRGDIDVLIDWLLVDEPDLTIGPVIDHQARTLAVSADHPLARRASVSVEDLADWDHADSSTMPTALIDGILPPTTPTGRPIHRTLPVNGMTELIAYIVNGWIVHATVESLRLQTRRDAIVTLPLTGLPPLPLGLIYRTGRHAPSVHALVAVANTLHVPPTPNRDCPMRCARGVI